jgi:hypothetical protein
VSAVERIARARVLLGEALTLAREVMVEAFDSGRYIPSSDAEEAADLIHDASMALEAARRGWM